jgi:glycosyltransferase involved in cell wall biosynthesis
MPWIPKEKTIILENKFKSVLHLPLPTVQSTHFPKKLSYTGTIAHIYGTLEAIELAEYLHKQNPDTTLVLAGFCQDPAYWQKILTATKDKPWITLIGGLSPVPYSEIEKVLRACDAGILSYLANDSFTNKCPTRYYELAALAKGVLISKGLAFSINIFTKINTKELLNTKFDLLNSALPSSAFTWDSQKLSISLLNKLLNI